jgi:RimJ/RimL family protein N-acetyltransferase
VTDVSALRGLRLSTPRLELRLGDRSELEALARVAIAGIHPPDEMPFAVAWTDTSHEPGFVEGFVAFHEAALSAWAQESWTLNLLAFADGEVVGTQGLSAEQFAAERTVETGSWLGIASQGRGLGTEMRTAALELAFGHLGAREAHSGWLESGAGQSAGVSAKLGYREAGVSIGNPRGAPVVRHDLVLERADWRCPIVVEAEGVDECLPLFGAGGR